MQKLAHAMLEEDASELTRERAVGILDAALPAMPAARAQGDGAEIFRHLLHRTGLLRERSGESVDFVHRTFQDYLAAKEIVARGRFPTLVDHAHQSEWEEVIRMAAAHARPEECAQFLERLLAPAPGLRRPQINHRRLMAAACLDHVTELDPAVQRLVHDRTKNLVRPTTELAARGLGWVGPIVLELLPDPGQVPDDRQALLLASTATRVQDDAAIDYLVRLRSRAALPVRTELARGWRHFDTERYAQEIIAHLDPDGLYFPVADTAELAALRELGGRPRIQVAGVMRAEELLAGLLPDQLTHLWLNAELPDTDVSWLSGFPGCGCCGSIPGCRGCGTCRTGWRSRRRRRRRRRRGRAGRTADYCSVTQSLPSGHLLGQACTRQLCRQASAQAGMRGPHPHDRSERTDQTDPASHLDPGRRDGRRGRGGAHRDRHAIRRRPGRDPARVGDGGSRRRRLRHLAAGLPGRHGRGAAVPEGADRRLGPR